MDLRNNPGGDRQQSCLSEFRRATSSRISKGRSETPKRPLTINRQGHGRHSWCVDYRNSASRIRDCRRAVQDHGRGLVVGETSFGKGLVQHVFQLPFTTGLTLTTARYYTPYGRSLQRDYSSGSLYDYYVRHDESGEQQVIQPGQPSPAESSEPRSSNAPAFRTAAGRVFYGGGGITPDIEARPLTATPARANRKAFYFTENCRRLVHGAESYRLEKLHRSTSEDVDFRSRIEYRACKNFGEGPATLDRRANRQRCYFVKLLCEPSNHAAFGGQGQRFCRKRSHVGAFSVLPERSGLPKGANGTPVSST